MMLFRDKASAAAVLDALKQPGADFAGLAKGLSEDESTKGQGGDMGCFERADYAKVISDVAFSMKPGETSGLVQGPDGFVILRALDRKPAGPLGLDEVRGEIRQRLQSDQQQQVRNQWLVSARKAARLEIPDKKLKEGVQSRLETTKSMPMPGEL
jgi:parvulin-like peptidyl-prolyl isomerase